MFPLHLRAKQLRDARHSIGRLKAGVSQRPLGQPVLRIHLRLSPSLLPLVPVLVPVLVLVALDRLQPYFSLAGP